MFDHQSIAKGGISIRQRPNGTVPQRINYEYATALALAHLAACLAFVPNFFSWTGVGFLMISVPAFTMLGINIGFHRLISHRSFQCAKWLEYSLAAIGTCCLQESPAWWAAAHREHHRHADEAEDPHSPIGGLFWSHAGWLLVKNRQFDTRASMHRYVRDLMRQPFYAWIDRKTNMTAVYVAHAIGYFACGYTIGWLMVGQPDGAWKMGCSVLVWGVFVRTVMVLHITWVVNSLGHCWGYRNFETPDSSRNNLLFGILAHGDGWHNNHHAHPNLARHGHKWWEVDMSYWVICLFEKLGLIWNVKRKIPAKAVCSVNEALCQSMQTADHCEFPASSHGR